MKHHKPLLAKLAATLLAGAALNLQAQSWVNIYDPAHGGLAGSCAEITTDAAGNLYAAGSTKQTTDGSMRAIVQGSGDHGATWTVLDQFAEVDRNYAHNRAVATDGNTGSILAGGNLNNLLPNGTYEFDTLWFIREWNPLTQVWSTVDHYSNLANDIGQASCADILVTPSGDAYATGGGQLGLVVRKRLAGASAFTTVHMDYSGRSSGAGWDLAWHPTFGVFVAAEVNGIWTVRRSLSGNPGTWSTLDSFYVTRQWTGGYPKYILTTPSKIHVGGCAYNASTRKYHWMVRSSADGGATWSITDNVAPSGSLAEARGIVEDSSGNLVVCGIANSAAGDSHWIVRKGTKGTKLVKQGKKWVQVETITWSTTDDYQMVSGKSAKANCITVDSNGAILVGGNATDATDVYHWIVRKLTP
jgi:hypothetical protein